jgi:hypothetical protein
MSMDQQTGWSIRQQVSKRSTIIMTTTTRTYNNHTQKKAYALYAEKFNTFLPQWEGRIYTSNGRDQQVTYWPLPMPKLQSKPVQIALIESSTMVQPRIYTLIVLDMSGEAEENIGLFELRGQFCPVIYAEDIGTEIQRAIVAAYYRLGCW